MNATLPVSGAVSVPTRSSQRKRPSFTLPSWTRHLHMLSTVLLIVAVTALSIAAFGPNGIGGSGNGSDDGPGMFAAVPIATVPDGAETSSIPYPTADECTVEPMTQDEIVEDMVAEANSPSPHVSDLEAADPTEAEATEILAFYREFQACELKGAEYQIALMTPFSMLQLYGLFTPEEGPDNSLPTEQEIVDLVDTITFAADMDTPVVGEPVIATSVDAEANWFRRTIFPDDITMYGPGTASVVAYWVEPESREMAYFEPTIMRLVNEDGQWLIDYTREGLSQG